MKKHLLDRIRSYAEADSRVPGEELDRILEKAFQDILIAVVASHLNKEPDPATLFYVRTSQTSYPDQLHVFYDGEHLGTITLNIDLPCPSNKFNFKMVYTFIPDTYHTK